MSSTRKNSSFNAAVTQAHSRKVLADENQRLNKMEHDSHVFSQQKLKRKTAKALLMSVASMIVPAGFKLSST